ncbi:hypothetical protein AOZ06_23395 [Kibdelosporangium phytohabitans]|uniref:N-acetyltransferase domain-containing protein n=1 Tax=Kibdelosporangium phytohabitans TaxID=860235 RepID=A0A0N9I4E4_9PSEU|nr:hypothetical protein AOZ06_23395 [Kibdelosporangium phytohabitans]
MLRLEADTIWGREPGGIACDTVFVTVTTYDGRAEVIDGQAVVASGTPTAMSVARSWVLPSPPTPPSAPAGYSLVHEPRDLRRPVSWDADEWALLMSGAAGPWAAVVDGDEVASLAHCARWTERAAEVGVRTEDPYQRRGLAPVVARAWATLLADHGKVLFYSADEDNTASHRVAAKCDARPLGLLCQLSLRR